jgi:hypothetical protein
MTGRCRNGTVMTKSISTLGPVCKSGDVALRPAGGLVGDATRDLMA